MSDKRKVFQLSDILDAFKTSLDKTAGDEVAPGVPVAMAQDPQAQQAQAQAQSDAEAQAQAQAAQQEAEAQAQAQQDPDNDGDNDTANESVVAAAQNVVNADQQLDNSVDVLKSIAKQAAEKEEEALEKDASEFGKIFANSFIDEVNTRSEIETIRNQAYDITMQKVAEEAVDPEMTEKIVKEAYDITMQKIAEYDNTISEDVYNSIIKEAYDLTMNSIEETNVLDELSEITKVAYQHTMDQINGLKK